LPASACPQCGAEIGFQSAALPVKVCPHCQALVMRTDTGLSAVGQSATLPFDVSPIMLGTTGRHDGVAFAVIGRVRWGWEEGSWNEWLLQFVDGSIGWLGEAMGAFMLTREVAPDRVSGPAADQFLRGDRLHPDDPIAFDGKWQVVSDIKRATCIASEGELPFRAQPGWSIDSVDFKSVTEDCLSAQRESGVVSFYAGRYVRLADIGAVGLRAFEGWATPDYGG